MASGALVEGGGDLRRNRWIDTKVYTRKCFRKKSIGSQQPISSIVSEDGKAISSLEKVQEEQPPSSRVDLVVSDDSTIISSQQQQQDVVVVSEKGQPEPPNEPPNDEEEETLTKKSSVQTTESHVNIYVAGMSKQEIREVKQKLVDELEQVRSLLVEVEAKELEMDVDSEDDDCVDVAMDDGCDELALDGCVEVAVGVADVLDCYNPSQLSSNDLVESGGIRSLASDTYYTNGGSRRKISEVSLGKVHTNGIISEAHLDNGCPRLTTPEVSMDYGGERRMIPEVSLDNGSGRMFSSGHLDSGATGRMIPVTTLDSYGGRRMISEVNSFGKREHPRSFNQLRVSVMENRHTGLGEYVEKEKRTPKANSYYKNPDFIMGMEKLPSNKKLKTNSKKHGRGGERGYGFSMIKHSSQVFKHCGALLSRLLKHKHGWVFKAPVDVEGLGLHDYYLIIKHPMDLGTVKTRLNANWYKTPREFAEDVRLTFYNAMTYNPKGQDVHIMAEQLSQIFEERWAVMESEYNLDSWFELYHDVNFSPAGVTKAPHVFSEGARTFERVDTPQPIQPKPRTYPLSRGTALKKPKAKDMNKREMTYDEKQKLSTQLQALPPEKLDNIVEIIKRRNTSLLQHDDEIEVDIDSVDTETLWELDRFVTNFKKSLSKYKRKQELATQARAEAERIARERCQATSMGGDVLKETRIDENNGASRSPHQEDNQQENSSRSSSSSSSSSDSSSSSSDSDSDSSSESEAEGGNSPRANGA
ncbi:hypothetical protein ACHQM5_017699 [Ranunculus cassubicifolius]